MSTLSKSVVLEFLTKFDKNTVKPLSRRFTWTPSNDNSSVRVISDFAIIPAATTATLSYATHTDGIVTIFEDPDKTGEITLKINGDTNGNALADFRVISGAITGLIGINANATESRIVKFYTIIPSGVISSNETGITIGIVQDFLSLSDTPDSYTDKAGYTVKVNDDEDALEFIENNVFPTREVDSTDDIESTDDIIFADASGGGFTLTLVDPVTIGKIYRVIKTDSGFNVVTVTPESGTINGAASYELTTPYEGKGFVYDGTNWFTVNLN